MGSSDREKRCEGAFLFAWGKESFHRAYRRLVDWRLVGKYRMTDYFFALSQQYQKDRLLRVSRLASEASVELMTHPARHEEYAFLLSEGYLGPYKVFRWRIMLRCRQIAIADKSANSGVHSSAAGLCWVG